MAEPDETPRPASGDPDPCAPTPEGSDRSLRQRITDRWNGLGGTGQAGVVIGVAVALGAGILAFSNRRDHEADPDNITDSTDGIASLLSLAATEQDSTVPPSMWWTAGRQTRTNATPVSTPASTTSTGATMSAALWPAPLGIGAGTFWPRTPEATSRAGNANAPRQEPVGGGRASGSPAAKAAAGGRIREVGLHNHGTLREAPFAPLVTHTPPRNRHPHRTRATYDSCLPVPRLPLCRPGPAPDSHPDLVAREGRRPWDGVDHLAAWPACPYSSAGRLPAVSGAGGGDGRVRSRRITRRVTAMVRAVARPPRNSGRAAVKTFTGPRPLSVRLRRHGCAPGQRGV